MESLEDELQVSSNEVGTGDVASQDEADLRATLIAAFKREGNFYDRMTIKQMKAPELKAALANLPGKPPYTNAPAAGGEW